jgi:hypothetical protein
MKTRALGVVKLGGFCTGSLDEIGEVFVYVITGETCGLQ